MLFAKGTGDDDPRNQFSGLSCYKIAERRILLRALTVTLNMSTNLPAPQLTIPTSTGGV